MHELLASLAEVNLLNFGHFVSKGLSFVAAFASAGLSPAYLVYPEGWALDALHLLGAPHARFYAR